MFCRDAGFAAFGAGQSIVVNQTKLRDEANACRRQNEAMTQPDGIEALHDRGFRARHWKELLTFLVLALGIWPVVAVGVVGGYGFVVWMWQIVFGPPGPPG